MEKLDWKRKLGCLHRPSPRDVSRVEVPTLNFLMVDGVGDPDTSRTYAEAVEALFTLSYALKFAARKGPLAVDYGVMPREGLWWADDMSGFMTGDRAAWRWTMMIAQPGVVGLDLVDATAADVLKRKNPFALPLVVQRGMPQLPSLM